MDEFAETLACLVGRAESSDGGIRAEWTAEKGLRSLYLAPSAKDRGHHALAKAVVEVSNMALEDLQAQIRRAVETARNKDGAASDTTTPGHDADQAAVSPAEAPRA